jgi:hypothetical protein
MHKPDDPDAKKDRPSESLKRVLSDELRPIEPPADVREDMLERILNRTVRTWREWLTRPKNRLDD